MSKKNKRRLMKTGTVSMIIGLVLSFGWTSQDVSNGINWVWLIIGVALIVTGIICYRISENSCSYERAHEYYWLEDVDEEVDY